MLIFLISLVVILVTICIKSSFKSKNYPPGPLFLPFIGSWYAVPGQGIENKVPEWRKKYGNIIGHKIGGKNLVVITGYKEMVSALKNNNFQNRLHTTTLSFRTYYQVLGMFFADGEQYNEIRRFTLRFLGQAAAARINEVFHEEIMDFFSIIESEKITRVDGEFMSFAMNIFLTFLIGNSKKLLQNETKTFRKVVFESFRTGRPAGIENFYPPLGIFYRRKPQFVANEYVQNFFNKQLKEHKETFNPNNIRDYIDAFLLEQEKEKKSGQTQYYTDEELISCLLDMGQAASESVGNTATFLLMYVALHPEVEKKMQNELDTVLKNRLPVAEDKSNLPYCVSVIDETMRINTVAATAVSHIVTEDTQFYGYTIPEGTMIIFPLWEMFRNSEDFEEPTSFKPERFISKEVKSKIISFGLGKRSCVGELMAKRVLFLFATYFFQKYSISFPKGYEHPDTEPMMGFTNSPKPFYLIITERQSK